MTITISMHEASRVLKAGALDNPEGWGGEGGGMGDSGWGDTCIPMADSH